MHQLSIDFRKIKRSRLAFATLALPILALPLQGFVYEPTRVAPDAVLAAYLADWSKEDYHAMYQLLSPSAKAQITEAAFVQRYIDIASRVSLTALKPSMSPQRDGVGSGSSSGPTTNNQFAQFTYTATWYTAITDPFSAHYHVTLSNSPSGWAIDWIPQLILPQLQSGWTVHALGKSARRGEIVDRKGVPLAVDVPAYDIGVEPGKLKKDGPAKVASILGVKTSEVSALLHQSWVKPDLFVPLKTVVKSQEMKLKKRLLAVPGVLIAKSSHDIRWYPQGTLAAQTIGYIGAISATELTSARKLAGYTPSDLIGKTGIENEYESQLRGTRGGEIWLDDATGQQQTVIAQRPATPGDTVRLTLDVKVQRALESSLSGQVGGAVVLNPSTGAVLGIASAPTYNPNLLISGVSASEWKRLTQNVNAPFVNRALSAVTPGSVIKPFITSIGLDAHALTPKTVYPTDPIHWQQGPSWGKYYVTRVEHPPGNPDLLHALIWSDNVYFAQTGLKIGSKRLVDGLNRWGLGRPFSFDLPVRDGQVSNSGSIVSETQLADSAYGQGQVLVSPVQLASMFTAFLNRGNTLQPYLIANIKNAHDGVIIQGRPHTLAKGVVSGSSIKFIQSALHQVVTDPAGTAHGISDVRGWTVSGKTGTAQREGGANGSDWGWFSAWISPAGHAPKYLVTMVLANTQNHGGSHETVHHVRQFLEALK